MTKMKLVAATLCAVLLATASLTAATAQEGVVTFKNRDVATQDVAQRSETAPAYGQELQPVCVPTVQTYQYCEPTACVPIGGRLLGRLNLRRFSRGSRFFYGRCSCCGGCCEDCCCCGYCCCCCCCYWNGANNDDDSKYGWEEWNEEKEELPEGVGEDNYGNGKDEGELLLVGGDLDFHTLFGNNPEVTRVAY